MDDTQRKEQFKLQLASTLADLKSDGVRNVEAMALIGSLATELADRLGQNTWSQAKTILSAQQFDELLTSFRLRGNQMQQSGKSGHVYALQALSVSLVAKGLSDDADIAAGEQLLDALIDRTVSVTRKGIAATKN
ncbi:hypothetical protein [Devosia chinhatensis]|uniref:Uncharacterized protein n=1 Tax=Devosia chinhatensis TaxID=429727 RepID=A0A0F5FNB9_9HYPH|nr:hypothetical protein [Devosia chinhatensis]KKB10040.1 hypothetical protein VE26_09640 [Devosia chinhatensis]